MEAWVTGCNISQLTPKESMISPPRSAGIMTQREQGPIPFLFGSNLQPAQKRLEG